MSFKLKLYVSQTIPLPTDFAIVALTIVLVVLTIVLVWLGADTSRKLKQLNTITERFFHFGLLLAGSFLEETVYIPVDWVKDDSKSVVAGLSRIEGVDAELLDKEIRITYRLNQEKETVKVLLEGCREPSKISEKLSLYARL